MLFLVFSIAIGFHLLTLKAANGDSCTQGFMNLTYLEESAKQICNNSYCPPDYTTSPVRLLSTGNWITSTMMRPTFVCRTVIVGVHVIARVESPAPDAVYPKLTLWRRDGDTLRIRESQEIRLGPQNFATSGVFHYIFPKPMQVDKSRNILGVMQPDNSPVKLQYAANVNSDVFYVNPDTSLNEVLQSNRTRYQRKLLIVPDIGNYLKLLF